MRTKHNTSGFSIIELGVILLVVGLLGFIGYTFYKNHQTASNTTPTTATVASVAPIATVPVAPTITSTADLTSAETALNSTSGQNATDNAQLSSEISNF